MEEPPQALLGDFLMEHFFLETAEGNVNDFRKKFW